jgi:hypothetical protein
LPFEQGHEVAQIRVLHRYLCDAANVVISIWRLMPLFMLLIRNRKNSDLGHFSVALSPLPPSSG